MRSGPKLRGLTVFDSTVVSPPPRTRASKLRVGLGAHTPPVDEFPQASKVNRPGFTRHLRMSRRGNRHDNGVAESFLQLLQRERIRRKIYLTRDADRSDVFDYIEMLLQLQAPTWIERRTVFRTVRAADGSIRLVDVCESRGGSIGLGWALAESAPDALVARLMRPNPAVATQPVKSSPTAYYGSWG